VVVEGADGESEDENDPSKLSLAERVRLFNAKMTAERLPLPIMGGPMGPTRRRFKTQPVTTEEVSTAKVLNEKPLGAQCMLLVCLLCFWWT